MKKLALGCCLLAMTAWAGDTLLGVILVSDGGTVSNATTGYGSAGCAAQGTSPGGAGACAQSFRIGCPMLISIQCKDQGAKVAVNQYTVDAGQGVTLAADQFLTDSTGSCVYVPPGTVARAGVLDGGFYTGGVVAISPLAGAARAECNVYSRVGNE